MVGNFEVTLPSNQHMSEFGEFARDCFQQRENLSLQNQKLRIARDLLLPKLMNGELNA
jgi:type I restriction enzyme S subunit